MSTSHLYTPTINNDRNIGAVRKEAKMDSEMVIRLDIGFGDVKAVTEVYSKFRQQ